MQKHRYYRHQYRNCGHNFFHEKPNESWGEKEWGEYRQARHDHEKEKFYKHLTWYIAVNAFFMFQNIRHGNPFGSMSVAFFWGIGLFFHYVKVFGWPKGDDWFNDNRKNNDDDDFDDDRKDDEPKWKDKDLV
jgi:hypothetical protein